MISLIDELIFSYVFTNSSIDIYEIQRIINEPIGLISDKITQLYDSGYLKKTDDGEIKLTQKVLLYSPKQWGIWFEPDKVDSVDKFNIEYNDNIQRDVNKYPIIDSESALRDMLKLAGVKIDAYHEYILYIDGKQRKITSPSKMLKKRQKWILNNILNLYDINDCVHGFVKGKSIVTNASCHIGQREIGCIDIKDFFPSVSYNQVLDVFLSVGYNEETAKSLADLCTYNDCLPQGAPTSPMLANIVLKDFDNDVCRYAEMKRLIYSRYADDITISGDYISDEDLNYLQERLSFYGFCINKRKTHISCGKHRKIVTGLIVNETSVKVPRAYKRQLEQEI